MVMLIETLPPEQLRPAASQLGRLASLVGQEPDARRRALHCLTIGKLLFRLYRSSADPHLSEPQLGYAHGALQQALHLLAQTPTAYEYAEACYHLGWVCAEIARWGADPATARRALDLQTVAAEHASMTSLRGLGLIDVDTAREDAVLMVDELDAGDDDPDLALVGRLTLRRLDLAGLQAWLADAYGVTVTPQPGLFREIVERVRGWIAVALELPGGQPAPAGILLGGQVRELRTRGEPAGPSEDQAPDSPPAVLPFGTSFPIDADLFPGVYLEADAISPDRGTDLELVERTLHGQDTGRRFEGWTILIEVPGASEPVESAIGADGSVALPDLPFDLFQMGRVTVRPPASDEGSPEA